MSESTEREPDAELLEAATRLNGNALALLLGLVGGLGLFVATNWLLIKGGPPGDDGQPVIGPNLSLLGQYLPGYEVSFVGSLIGFLWGLALGAVAGLVIGRGYNWIAAIRESR